MFCQIYFINGTARLLQVMPITFCINDTALSICIRSYFSLSLSLSLSLSSRSNTAPFSFCSKRIGSGFVAIKQTRFQCQTSFQEKLSNLRIHYYYSTTTNSYSIWKNTMYTFIDYVSLDGRIDCSLIKNMNTKTNI